jgi:hypothetical protein
MSHSHHRDGVGAPTDSTTGTSLDFEYYRAPGGAFGANNSFGRYRRQHKRPKLYRFSRPNY